MIDSTLRANHNTLDNRLSLKSVLPTLVQPNNTGDNLSTRVSLAIFPEADGTPRSPMSRRSRLPSSPARSLRQTKPLNRKPIVHFKPEPRRCLTQTTDALPPLVESVRKGWETSLRSALILVSSSFPMFYSHADPLPIRQHFSPLLQRYSS